jgi:hypothetical protein
MQTGNRGRQIQHREHADRKQRPTEYSIENKADKHNMESMKEGNRCSIKSM